MKTSQLIQVTWAAANAGNRSLWNLFTTTKIYKNIYHNLMFSWSGFG